jgi:hypothetical protein
MPMRMHHVADAFHETPATSLPVTSIVQVLTVNQVGERLDAHISREANGMYQPSRTSTKVFYGWDPHTIRITLVTELGHRRT